MPIASIGSHVNKPLPAIVAAVIAGLALGGCTGHAGGGRLAAVRTAGRPGAASRPASTNSLPNLAKEASLADCLVWAAAGNPGLKGAFESWKASLEEIPQARSLPDPQFSYMYFVEEVETRVGAQRQAMALSQTFPWLAKLTLRADMAAQAAAARHERYQAAKLRLFYRVKDAYFECYYLGRAIAVTEENLRLMTHLERVARSRYRAAAGSHPDVIRAQVELGKLDDRLGSLRRLRGPLVARLNAAMNRPPLAVLPLPKDCPEESVAFTEKKLLADLSRSNPELKALDRQIERQRRSIELARQAYFPDVTVGARYVDVSPSTGGRHPSDDGKDALAATVSVNVPIWWEKYAAGVRQARARYRAARYAKSDKMTTLEAEVVMAAYQVRDTERKIDLYRDTLVAKAQQALKATEATYRVGKGSFNDLVDAERILLEFELAAERALTDHAQTVARLEMLVGRDLPRKAGNGKQLERKKGNEDAGNDVQSSEGKQAE